MVNVFSPVLPSSARKQRHAASGRCERLCAEIARLIAGDGGDLNARRVLACEPQLVAKTPSVS